MSDTKITPKRCLILSCSASKSDTPNPLPALERYRGPAFSVVKRYLRLHPDALGSELLIGILSAEYGLIQPDTHILSYDRRMTHDRAMELQLQVTATLKKWLKPYHRLRLFLMLGRDYQTAVEPLTSWLPSHYKELTIASGGSGKKQQQLALWLDEHRIIALPTQMALGLADLSPRGYAVLRGETITATPDEILTLVERWLDEGDVGYLRSRDWVAKVGPYTVAPKWLVSRLSDVPVNKFTADEARRVLQQLGILVLRR